MKRLSDGSFQFSPTDLVNFLEGEFAAWAERRYAERQGRAQSGNETFEPDPDDDETALIKQRGEEHEARVLAALTAQHQAVLGIARGDAAAVDKTLDGMRAGATLIYQGHLVSGAWHGYPDFLMRSPAPSDLGDWSYWPLDAKLAHSARAKFVVQLCGYADLLHANQGALPERLGFVLGTDVQQELLTNRYYWFYRYLKRVFERYQATFDAARVPDPAAERSFGRWASVATLMLEAADSPALIARISRGQVKRLREAGILTAAQLVASTEPIRRVTPKVLERLRRQARLQAESRDKMMPAFEVLPHDAGQRVGLAMLPPAAPGDVYLDLEGFPLRRPDGLEYLFGAVTVNGGKPEFRDWWAHDETQEKAAFEQVVDWIYARWKSQPGMHVYHYAGYETTAFGRLMGKYATREKQVDDLLRGDVFVDLYAVTRNGVAIGTRGYSLKDIEVLCAPERSALVLDASSSVVEYQRWIESGEPGDWRASPILAEIRTYNREDCEHTWLLAEWLRARQTEAAIAYVPPEEKQQPEDERDDHPNDVLAAELLTQADGLTDGEDARVTRLVARLLGYHRRENKPMWWWFFERCEATEEELADDAACLAGLTRTDTPPVREKRSWIVEYAFDLEQDTKLDAGSSVYVVGGEKPFSREINSFDGDTGRLTIKFGRTAAPDRCHLIPNEHVSAEPIEEALERFGTEWKGGTAPRFTAVRDLLYRRPPATQGRASGALLAEKPELPADLVSLVAALDGTTLCIQGPPGSGKTHNAAAVIVALASAGKRVAVASNSHKAVLNLLRAVSDDSRATGKPVNLVKVKEDDKEPGDDLRMRFCESAETAGLLEDGVVVGGTAWAFSRPELEQQFDYLFVDEAGQVSLANAVAMGLTARNIVLIGDQMQLAQPAKGSHPPQSGLSCFHYYLEDLVTVPADRGVLLPLTWRLHPDICRFISDTAYEGRLQAAPPTSGRCIVPPPDARLMSRGTGILMLDVEHEGNSQDSPEEVTQIAAIVAELRRSQVKEEGVRRPFDLGKDLLVVAPYNAQVRRLRDALGSGVRVASVDKFQGQQAPVVIVSMSASTLEDSPRGAEFLLSPNRLNVAVSRAKCLAIIVSSPRLIRTRPASVREIELLNLFCRLRFYADDLHASAAVVSA